MFTKIQPELFKKVIQNLNPNKIKLQICFKFGVNRLWRELRTLRIKMSVDLQNKLKLN